MSGKDKRGNYEEPFSLEMDTDEALERFAQADPKEADEAVLQLPITLVQDEGGAERFLIYGTGDGAELELRVEENEPWFTQKQLSEIFGVDVRTVNEHVLKFISDGELDESVIRNFRITATDGKPYNVKHYALDVAFYVGYRVNSTQGVLFRKWATRVLTAFATKGFAIHTRRLKDPENFDRVKELREIIAEIRAGDVNFYGELRRICALCQDYDPKSKAWRDFYAHMRAKLYWATVRQTPSMVLKSRADASKPNMGMVSWEKEEPVQKDALSPPSYLADFEFRELNSVTVILLDVFADQADQGRLTTMAEASALLERQLETLQRPILRDGGRVGTDDAKDHAKREYDKFNAARKAARLAAETKALEDLRASGKALPKTKAKKKI